ncbi:MAG: hypothetical protein AMJ84_14195 [Acidithiobacillales bacterium SM23_46]|nr:MAG: hypothetical protein AMJ84_14195 [Acidithiobacillales bacterium SM23_46]
MHNASTVNMGDALEHLDEQAYRLADRQRALRAQQLRKSLALNILQHQYLTGGELHERVERQHVRMI